MLTKDRIESARRQLFSALEGVSGKQRGLIIHTFATDLACKPHETSGDDEEVTFAREKLLSKKKTGDRVESHSNSPKRPAPAERKSWMKQHEEEEDERAEQRALQFEKQRQVEPAETTVPKEVEPKQFVQGMLLELTLVDLASTKKVQRILTACGD